VKIAGGSFSGRPIDEKLACPDASLEYHFFMGLIQISGLLLLFAIQVKAQVGEKCFGPLSYGMSDDTAEDALSDIGIQRIRESSEPLALKQTFNNSGVVAWDRIENEKNMQIFERKSFRGRVVEEIAQVFCYFFKTQAANNLGLPGSKGLQAVIVIFDPLEKDCLSTFEKLQNIVSERNGVPSKVTRNFEEPFFKNDGYTETAIKAGKCTYEANWQHPTGSQSIWLRIGKDMKIMLYYQSSTFGEIVDRDLKRKKDLL
jgi:hypothetical protein